jgi:hypothetical protein
MGTAYDPYTPVVGHTFDIITLTGAGAPGDYDGGGTVGPEDYTVWKQKFGTTDAAADGNGDGTVDLADYIVWNKNQGAMGSVGDITGTFDALTHDLPAGFDFVVHYLATKVQLEIVAAGSGGAVPEPSALVLIGLVLPLAAGYRRCR